jgi:uncharacterized protein
VFLPGHGNVAEAGAALPQPLKEALMSDHGTFYWNELNTRDPGRAREFYGSTLGWTFEKMPMPGGGAYHIAKQDGKPVAGIFDTSSPDFTDIPPHWLAYIAVDNIDERVAAAKKAGAQVTREPFDVEGVGRIAILMDAVGAAIGWMTPAQ